MAVGAAILLLGRGAAVLYADHAWYDALGAVSVWDAKVRDTVLIYALTLLVGFAFAFVNLLAVRQSIVALILPARVGSLDIGAEVPRTKLIAICAGVSLFAAGVGTLAAPSWTTLAIWRSDVTFGESDPYFGLDLAHFVTWLPLQSAVYVWAFVVFAVVTLVVLVLYSLTPSLSWGRGAIRITTHVRRHVSVLAAILLLFTAWGFHLEAYHVMISGETLTTTFSQVAHIWLIPLDIALSLGTAGAAVVLLAAGWYGQTVVSLAIVSIVLLTSLVAKIAVPWIANISTVSFERRRIEAPYITTRRIYTDRAFPAEANPPSIQYLADSAVIASAPRLHLRGGGPDIVHPGAEGVAIQNDSARILHAPHLGTGLGRLMLAWSEQNPRLFGDTLPAWAAIVRYRDVRERVALLAPVFVQSRAIGWRPTPSGVQWIIDLYSTSDSYPLSDAQQVNGVRLTYRHHVATAYVNGMTGAVTIVPDRNADPVARAWFGDYRGSYLSAAAPAELTAPPPGAPAAVSSVVADTSGQMFRAHVAAIYARMRAALDGGDLRGFGEAFDSLGAVVGMQGPAPK